MPRPAATHTPTPEEAVEGDVSGIPRLALLAPDIIAAILTGRTDQGMMLEQLARPMLPSFLTSAVIRATLPTAEATS